MISTAVKVARWFLMLVAAVALAPAHPAGTGEPAGPETGTPGYSNRLIHSKNPYLLLHADNPVDWYPWGSEAFEKARLEDKPVFLSIGYSTCYWCHVAERTIYSNPEIAALMNRWFVNVKVDREQRPDVDRVYLLATQILTGRGGWPNNVFLTPDRKPFFAGSYFPPEDDPKHGAGFPTILKSIHEAWVNERRKVETLAEDIASTLRQAQSRETLWTAAPVDPGALLGKATSALLEQVDYRWGGFLDPASEAKFPRVPQLALLLLDYRLHQSPESLAAVTRTLHAMSLGGIHDHLAGGFHRYSVDASWSIPHFEKMLYDNAQLLLLYADTFEVTGDSLYRSMALETGNYIGRDMMSAEGGFYTARDAQVNGIEGAGYLWTAGQIADVLGSEAADRFLKVYRLTPLPHSGISDLPRPPEVAGEQPGVLRIRPSWKTAAESLGLDSASGIIGAFAGERGKLLTVRSQRTQPARDEKIIVSQNGLAILALAESAPILEQPRFLRWAERAADRIWRLAYRPSSGMLRREIYLGQAQTEGFLEDYALLGQAMLALARATGNGRWHERALMLSRNVIDRFLRGDGSFSTTQYETGLFVPVPVDSDLDMPSATSAALAFLLQANAVGGDATLARAVARALNRLSARIQATPDQWSSAVAAVNRYPLEQTTAASTAGASAGKERDFPSTARHVRASAAMQSGAAADRIIVTMEVDDGYHVNANPASFDYLIPTSLRFDGIEPLQVTYPDPTRFTPSFAPDGLDVYQGTVTLVATFPKGVVKEKHQVSGLITAQACNDQICLPPSVIPFSVESTESPLSP